MTDDELLQATLLALTRQNVVVRQGGTPKELSIGYIENVCEFVIWEGEIIIGVYETA